MRRLILDVDTQLYASLQSAAQAGDLSLEEECLRRLEGESVVRVTSRHSCPSCVPMKSSGAPVRGNLIISFSGSGRSRRR